MTPLGKYFNRKSVNKAEIARRTGISKSRLSELSLKLTTNLSARELVLIALAIEEKPGILIEEIYKSLIEQKSIN